MTVNVQQAKTRLSELLARVSAGETVTIAKTRRPVAQLVAIRKVGIPRKLGTAKGRFRVPDEFFDPLPEEVLRAFGM